jgi:RNA polymerase sigma-70 factor (family 1)
MGNLSNYSEEELIDLFKQGSHAAYTEIYIRYSGLLYLHAYNKLRNREEARDILQELFEVLWQRRTEIEFKTHLSGYLYQAVQNRIIKLYAHKKIRSNYVNILQEYKTPENNITDHLVREKQLAKMIEDEITALPHKMREVFLMSRKDNMSHKSISKHLGIEETTVRKHIQNALKILRTKFGFISFLFFLLR